MAKTLNEAIDLVVDMINAGSLVDPISSIRSGDYAYSDELRYSGQFPKVFITAEQPADIDYTFGINPEYQSIGNLEVYYYTKIGKEDLYGDSLGSYKNERLIRRFQQLIKDMINTNLTFFHHKGFHKIRFTGKSDIIPLRDKGLLASMTSFDIQWREV